MNGLTALGAMSKLADVLKTGDKDAPVSGTGTSFADLLAQAVAGETNGDAIAPEKLTQLAEVVSQFRGEARETLTDLFPDGVVTAGPELMEWAQTMLTRLDTMLGDIGASVADLGQVLAAVPPGEAVRAWDRLGYPRRALALHGAAVTITEQHGGQVPDDVDALLALPGVGPYTARAVAAFCCFSPVCCRGCCNVRRR